MKAILLAWAMILGLAAGALAEATGPVTNLPLPRFVSLKTGEGNARRGPSLSHKIDWVFTRRNMPLEVTDEYGHWRRVRDLDGAGGWMHYSLLSGVRTVIIREDLLALSMKPRTGCPHQCPGRGGRHRTSQRVLPRLVPDRDRGPEGLGSEDLALGCGARGDPGIAPAREPIRERLNQRRAIEPVIVNRTTTKFWDTCTDVMKSNGARGPRCTDWSITVFRLS